jgi:hypothetical protein
MVANIDTGYGFLKNNLKLNQQKQGMKKFGDCALIE